MSPFPPFRPPPRWFSLGGLVLAVVLATVGLGARFSSGDATRSRATGPLALQVETLPGTATTQNAPPVLRNGRPGLSPLPPAEEVWECEVIVIGGSLGGVAAASHAMQAGAKTCTIELTPWFGGQISSQGVSALDESMAMRWRDNFSQSWEAFKTRIRSQIVRLPAWSPISGQRRVYQTNSCWVGSLCFPPQAGDAAARQHLEAAARSAPGSRWESSIAFKGAEFDPTGREVVAVYAVRRIPRQADYRPRGLLSRELTDWYSWFDSDNFEKVPIRLQAPPGQRAIVIDATDTGELVAWANVPHWVGSDSRALTGEPNAADRANPDCTQAFTYPFVLAIRDDGGASRQLLSRVKSGFPRREHRAIYSLSRFPMFEGGSFFHYRRAISHTGNDPRLGTPAPLDLTLVNWNPGNDWNWMDPPLILTQDKLAAAGQQQNWMGGLSHFALRNGEIHALLFSEWLMETQSTEKFPLSHLAGPDSIAGTDSGLSMYPYIREGRRIRGRSAYGQPAFFLREQDIRKDMAGGRDFRQTAVAVTHYAVDMHGCRYRNGAPTYEAQKAGVWSFLVDPIFIPLESLIPQGVDNLLIGNKGIAASHIVNAATRVHYGEWSIGGAAGATAGWLVERAPTIAGDRLQPPDIIPAGQMGALQAFLRSQGLRHTW